MSSCPKCGSKRNPGAECLACGVIYAKADAVVKLAAESAALRQVAEERRKKEEAAAIAARLTPCQTCAAPIAKNVSKCPHCGATQRRKAGKIAYIGATLVIVFSVWGTNNDLQRQQESQAATDKLLRDRPDIAHRAAAKNLCDAALKSSLRDPESLVIEGFEQEYSGPTDHDPAHIWTSYSIRAKNGFGGYTSSHHICTVEIKNGTAEITAFAKS